MGTRHLAALIIVAAISGCASELPSPDGKRVAGQELKELITGATVYGRSYKRKQGFVERYYPDGRYEVAFTKTAYSDEYGQTHKGTWRINSNQVCYKVASLNSDGCAIIYRQYTQIEFVSPETGKATFFSYEIKYEGKEPPATAAAPGAPKSQTMPPAPPKPQTTEPPFDQQSLGTRINGKALTSILSGAAVYSWQNTPGTNRVEYFFPDGKYVIRFDEARKNLRTGDLQREFTGTWHVKTSALCQRLPDLRYNECSAVYSYSVYGNILFASVTSSEVYAYSTRIDPVGAKIAANGPEKPPEPVPAPQPIAPQPASKLKPVGSGSGFIVSNDTYVLTNAHVVKGCQAVTVLLDGRDVPAIIQARDRRNDLALLRLPAGKYSVAVFQGNNTLYPGDSVVAIGYPLSDILASEGNVSVGTVSALAGLGNNTSLMQISNPVQPGNSGGPLFDMSGHVVGVIVSRLDFAFALEAYGTLPQNVNFAIKSLVAIEFMHNNNVEFKTRKSTKELRPADVARKGRPATVPATCWE